jgi:hypothetical protein
MEQFDILAGGYAPQSWEENEKQQKLLSSLLIDLLRRSRALAVTPMASSVYPALPTPELNQPPANVMLESIDDEGSAKPT